MSSAWRDIIGDLTDLQRRRLLTILASDDGGRLTPTEIRDLGDLDAGRITYAEYRAHCRNAAQRAEG